MINTEQWAIDEYAKLPEAGRHAVRELFNIRTMVGPILSLKLAEVLDPLELTNWEERALRETAAYLPEGWTDVEGYAADSKARLEAKLAEADDDD